MSTIHLARTIAAHTQIFQVRVWAFFGNEAWIDLPGYLVLIIERRQSVLERIRRRGRQSVIELYGKGAPESFCKNKAT